MSNLKPNKLWKENRSGRFTLTQDALRCMPEKILRALFWRLVILHTEYRPESDDTLYYAMSMDFDPGPGDNRPPKGGGRDPGGRVPRMAGQATAASEGGIVNESLAECPGKGYCHCVREDTSATCNRVGGRSLLADGGDLDTPPSVGDIEEVPMWFKFHVDKIDDPSWGELSDTDRAVYVECTAYAKRHETGGKLPDARRLAWALRRDQKQVESVMMALSGANVGWVDETDCGEFELVNWDKEQPQAMSDAERARNYRQRKRHERHAPPRDEPSEASRTRVVKNREDQNRSEEREKGAPPPDGEVTGNGTAKTAAIGLWSKALAYAEKHNRLPEIEALDDDRIAHEAIIHMGGVRAIRKALNNDREESFLRAEFIRIYCERKEDQC